MITTCTSATYPSEDGLTFAKLKAIMDYFREEYDFDSTLAEREEWEAWKRSLCERAYRAVQARRGAT